MSTQYVLYVRIYVLLCPNMSEFSQDVRIQVAEWSFGGHFGQEMSVKILLTGQMVGNRLDLWDD